MGWTKKTLKKHLKTIIKINNDHIKELMMLEKENNDKALKIFKETNDVHLDKLNHNQQAHEKMIAENIGTDKFEGLENRVLGLEKDKSSREGSNKVGDVIKYLIGVFIGSIITGILLSLIIK